MGRQQRESLQHWLQTHTFTDNSQPVNGNTLRTYTAANKAFAAFCRSEGIRTPGELLEAPTEALQRYSDALQAQGYGPATIHGRLAAPCRALGVSMGDVSMPKRSAAAITRSREMERPGRDRDAADRANPRFGRLVAFQEVTGLRRSEIGRLLGRDLCRDENGEWCVCVERGKGGKVQFQRILSAADVEIVKTTFDGISEDQPVFTQGELANHIDLHALRGAAARRAYAYYADRLQADPAYRKTLIRQLADRYCRLHGLTGLTPSERRPEALQRRPDSATRDQAAKWLEKTLEPGSGQYTLRGDVAAKARAAGQPLAYDRLALLAVSVFHLSHWRLDVTITGYMVP